ncbi:MAG: hypothetical protein LUC92_08740 [Clostridiales bacterium]|nr:hypothetical protein [Clostridiales bacterium]
MQHIDAAAAAREQLESFLLNAVEVEEAAGLNGSLTDAERESHIAAAAAARDKYEQFLRDTIAVKEEFGLTEVMHKSQRDRHNAEAAAAREKLENMFQKLAEAEELKGKSAATKEEREKHKAAFAAARSKLREAKKEGREARKNAEKIWREREERYRRQELEDMRENEILEAERQKELDWLDQERTLGSEYIDLLYQLEDQRDTVALMRVRKSILDNNVDIVRKQMETSSMEIDVYQNYIDNYRKKINTLNEMQPTAGDTYEQKAASYRDYYDPSLVGEKVVIKYGTIMPETFTELEKFNKTKTKDKYNEYLKFIDDVIKSQKTLDRSKVVRSAAADPNANFSQAIDGMANTVTSEDIIAEINAEINPQSAENNAKPKIFDALDMKPADIKKELLKALDAGTTNLEKLGVTTISNYLKEVPKTADLDKSLSSLARQRTRLKKDIKNMSNKKASGNKSNDEKEFIEEDRQKKLTMLRNVTNELRQKQRLYMQKEAIKAAILRENNNIRQLQSTGETEKLKELYAKLNNEQSYNEYHKQQRDAFIAKTAEDVKNTEKSLKSARFKNNVLEFGDNMMKGFCNELDTAVCNMINTRIKGEIVERQNKIDELEAKDTKIRMRMDYLRSHSADIIAEAQGLRSAFSGNQAKDVVDTELSIDNLNKMLKENKAQLDKYKTDLDDFRGKRVQEIREKAAAAFPLYSFQELENDRKLKDINEKIGHKLSDEIAKETKASEIETKILHEEINKATAKLDENLVEKENYNNKTNEAKNAAAALTSSLSSLFTPENIKKIQSVIDIADTAIKFGKKIANSLSSSDSDSTSDVDEDAFSINDTLEDIKKSVNKLNKSEKDIEADLETNFYDTIIEMAQGARQYLGKVSKNIEDMHNDAADELQSRSIDFNEALKVREVVTEAEAKAVKEVADAKTAAEKAAAEKAAAEKAAKKKKGILGYFSKKSGKTEAAPEATAEAAETEKTEVTDPVKAYYDYLLGKKKEASDRITTRINQAEAGLKAAQTGIKAHQDKLEKQNKELTVTFKNITKAGERVIEAENTRDAVAEKLFNKKMEIIDFHKDVAIECNHILTENNFIKDNDHLFSTINGIAGCNLYSYDNDIAGMRQALDKVSIAGVPASTYLELDKIENAKQMRLKIAEFDNKLKVALDPLSKEKNEFTNVPILVENANFMLEPVYIKLPDKIKVQKINNDMSKSIVEVEPDQKLKEEVEKRNQAMTDIAKSFNESRIEAAASLKNQKHKNLTAEEYDQLKDKEKAQVRRELTIQEAVRMSTGAKSSEHNREILTHARTQAVTPKPKNPVLTQQTPSAHHN